MTTKPDNDNDQKLQGPTVGNRVYLWIVVGIWLSLLIVPALIGLYIRYTQGG